MRTAPLDVVESNCRFELRETLGSVISGTCDVYALSTACDWFRMLAACRLFRTGLAEEFARHIRYGPGAMLHYASRPAGQLTATRVLPVLCDALAARDWPLAAEVAALVPPERDARTEYEDDFAYARTLAIATMELTDDAGAAAGKRLAIQVETTKDLLSDPRVSIVTALARREAPSFESALTQLVEEREANFAERLASDDVPMEAGATTERLCVEGLALIALARQRGLETTPDHLQIPSLAIPRASRADPDRFAWQSVVQGNSAYGLTGDP